MADQTTAGSDYLNQLRMAVKETTLTVGIERWLIGGAETCDGTLIPQVAQAQAQLAEQVVLSRFPGPIISPLGAGARLPGCRLTSSGQEAAAQRWFDAIQRAEKMDKRYEREALISWFKWMP